MGFGSRGASRFDHPGVRRQRDEGLGAAVFALAGSRFVRCEHGLTEVLPGSVEALEGLVGDPKATDDLA